MKKPKLSETTIAKLYSGEKVTYGKYEYELKTEWNDKLNAYEEVLYRWDNDVGDYEYWITGAKGLWGFLKKV